MDKQVNVSSHQYEQDTCQFPTRISLLAVLSGKLIVKNSSTIPATLINNAVCESLVSRKVKTYSVGQLISLAAISFFAD
jgi:hypothetical protein